MSQNETRRRLVPVEQFAEYFHVSERTAWSMIEDGEITAYRIRSKIVRVDLNEVDAALTPIPPKPKPGATAVVAGAQGGAA